MAGLKPVDIACVEDIIGWIGGFPIDSGKLIDYRRRIAGIIVVSIRVSDQRGEGMDG